MNEVMIVKKDCYYYLTSDYYFSIIKGKTNSICLFGKHYNYSNNFYFKVLDYFQTTQIHFRSSKELDYTLRTFYTFYGFEIPDLILMYSLYIVDNKYMLHKYNNHSWSARYLPNYERQNTELNVYGKGKTKKEAINNLKSLAQR